MLTTIQQDANYAKVQIKGHNGDVITLHFDLTMPEAYLSPLFSNFVWAGIWENSVRFMVGYLDDNFDCVNSKNKSMIELGAGLGIPALYCSLKFDFAKCVISDREEDLFFVRRFLLKSSNITVSTSSSSGGVDDISIGVGHDDQNNANKKIQTVTYDWGEKEYPIRGEFYDLIVCVECISIKMYGKQSLHNLKTAILKVKHANSIVLLCSEVRKDDGLDEFMELITPHCTSLEKTVHHYENNTICIIRALLL